MPQFLTNQQAQQRIAKLSASITTKGGTPKTYGSFLTSPEAHAAIAELEGQLASLQGSPLACGDQPHGKPAADLVNEWEACKQAKRRAGDPTPVASCLAEQQGETLDPDIRRRLAALDAATKRLESIHAAARADKLKLEAQAAAMAAVSRTPHLDKFYALTGEERTRFYTQNRTAIRAEETAKGMGGRVTIDADTGIITQTKI